MNEAQGVTVALLKRNPEGCRKLAGVERSEASDTPGKKC